MFRALFTGRKVRYQFCMGSPERTGAGIFLASRKCKVYQRAINPLEPLKENVPRLPPPSAVFPPANSVPIKGKLKIQIGKTARTYSNGNFLDRFSYCCITRFRACRVLSVSGRQQAVPASCSAHSHQTRGPAHYQAEQHSSCWVSLLSLCLSFPFVKIPS